MAGIALVCIDGSDESLRAVGEGLAVLALDLIPVVVTVVADADPTLVTGTGMAGGVLTPEEYDREQAQILAGAREVVAEGVRRLGAADAEQHVLVGSAGHAICEYAVERQASAVVLGSHGRGGFKRAVLGSVSDHVVRHAPCPVIVVGPDARD
ncbi:MAG: universal stress protein, partial [Acidimicrobiales bacterium]|nr:universal stress protein [Acidimicrobiales bacterium]